MYKIFDMRTCGLSHQIKGPVIVNLTILQLKPDIANFTVVGKDNRIGHENLTLKFSFNYV